MASWPGCLDGHGERGLQHVCSTDRNERRKGEWERERERGQSGLIGSICVWYRRRDSPCFSLTSKISLSPLITPSPLYSLFKLPSLVSLLHGVQNTFGIRTAFTYSPLLFSLYLSLSLFPRIQKANFFLSLSLHSLSLFLSLSLPPSPLSRGMCSPLASHPRASYVLLRERREEEREGERERERGWVSSEKEGKKA